VFGLAGDGAGDLAGGPGLAGGTADAGDRKMIEGDGLGVGKGVSVLMYVLDKLETTK